MRISKFVCDICENSEENSYFANYVLDKNFIKPSNQIGCYELCQQCGQDLARFINSIKDKKELGEIFTKLNYKNV